MQIKIANYSTNHGFQPIIMDGSTYNTCSKIRLTENVQTSTLTPILKHNSVFGRTKWFIFFEQVYRVFGW